MFQSLFSIYIGTAGQCSVISLDGTDAMDTAAATAKVSLVARKSTSNMFMREHLTIKQEAQQPAGSAGFASAGLEQHSTASEVELIDTTSSSITLSSKSSLITGESMKSEKNCFQEETTE